ncbi:MAG: hypothetical protein KAG12_09135, partial [Desulfuromusa sp.]|nr:hypothetical protein [Desulfuromusa sp.]
MKLIVRLSLVLLFFFPLTVLAEIPQQLKNDFAPISGTIIMPIGEEYLVDLDVSVNLQEGDILTLVMAGEKVIHPDTKELLGTVDLPKGYLQVTQVKSGYSYAKLLTAGVSPEKGDRIERYDLTPTRFESIQPENNLAAELKLALPHLNWLDDSDKTKAELFFMVDEKNLKITNAAGTELKTYQYSDGKLSAPMAGIYQADTFQLQGSPHEKKGLLNQAVAKVSTTIGFGKKDKRLEHPGITQSQKLNDGVWVGPNLDGNPVG